MGNDDTGEPAAAALPPAAWFYADPGRGPVGPYPEPDFRALALAGAMPAATPVWRAGLEWKPLAEHGPAQLGIPAATLKQAELAARADAARRAGGAGPTPAAEEEEEDAGALGEPDACSAEPSPPPGERSFVEDGVTFRWDSALRRFVEMEEGDIGPAAPPSKKDKKNKRSAADVLERRGGGGGGGGGGLAKKGRGGGGGDNAAPAPPPRPPTCVYVAGLPLDTTVSEVAAAFGKCGLIRPSKADPTGRTPAVKLYRDASTGGLKGDGTVTFLRPPSVDLALTLLDGVPLRAGPDEPHMSVSVAKFEEREGGGGGGGGGLPPPSAQQQPARAKRGRGGGGGQPANHTAALAARALAWDGFDDEAPPEAATAVLRWADSGLTAALLEGGKDALAGFEASIASVAGRVVGAAVGAGGGAVEAVRAYLGEPDGHLVATVRFRTPEGAAAAVAALPGKPLRLGGPAIAGAELWDGVATWRARPAKGQQKAAAAEAAAEAEGAGAGAGGDEDDQARLERFGADLFGD